MLTHSMKTYRGYYPCSCRDRGLLTARIALGIRRDEIACKVEEAIRNMKALEGNPTDAFRFLNTAENQARDSQGRALCLSKDSSRIPLLPWPERARPFRRAYFWS